MYDSYDPKYLMDACGGLCHPHPHPGSGSHLANSALCLGSLGRVDFVLAGMCVRGGD